MNVMSKLRVAFVSLALAAAGSAGAVAECPEGLIPVTESRLFFGLADAAGKVVTEDEWERFLANTVTPRFQAGLTVFEGRGQWLEPSGNLQRELVKVIVGAVTSGRGNSAPDSGAGSKGAKAIKRGYCSDPTHFGVHA